MQYDSLWSGTKSFFPLLCDYLEDNPAITDRAMIVGAADGKFVLPLCRFCKTVTAVEIDQHSVEGGDAIVSEGKTVRFAGLRAKVAAHGFSERVEIAHMDFQDFTCPTGFDVAFTS